jgi:hypothetical protein
MNIHRIKGQLKHTYKYMVEAFNSGMGCLEFTKNGNCHYHLKTQDDISDIYVFLDKLKGIRFMVDGKKKYVFGFTRVDVTKNIDQIGNYDYIEEDHLTTEQTLKKLGISDKYKALWLFKPKTTRFNDTSRRLPAYKNPFQHLTPEEYDAASSDTLDNLIIHNKH